MSNNLFKAGWVLVQNDKRVIDSNELMESKLKAAATRESRTIQDTESEDGFSEGIEPRSVAALVDEEQSEAVLKSLAIEERDEARKALEEAEEHLSLAREEAAEIVENAQKEVEAMREKTFEDANIRGYREGYDKGMAQVQAMKDEFLNKSKQLDLDYQKKIQELEPMFIETLTGIYEHIFKVDLSDYQPLISELLIDTMQKTGSTRNIMIHVSKEDFPAVSNAKEQIILETGASREGIEIVPDVTLARSECFLETESGIYDCSLETELAELKRKLVLLSYQK